jgi:hypothetical protein
VPLWPGEKEVAEESGRAGDGGTVRATQA